MVNSSETSATALSPKRQPPQTLAEKVMYSVKRIEVEGASGSWFGTGYALNEGPPENFFPLIVTNRHVTEGSSKISILFHTATSGVPDGGTANLVLTGNNSRIIHHPDQNIDLSIILVGNALVDWAETHQGMHLFWMAFQRTDFLSDEKLNELDACESVTMVGCPSGLWDEKNAFPLFRRGVTATHPAVDFQGLPQFVIDIGVYSGSSGSPVFLLEEGIIRVSKASTDLTPGRRFGLLGTLWGGPRITEEGKLYILPAPTDNRIGVQTPTRMHLGYVIKTRKLVELLEHMHKILDL